jgi:asparagine synthase (glutamine-hydrolysing)
MLNAIEKTIKQIESYDITTIRASVPMYLLSEYIREYTDIKVVLSGEGSDEASGSYLYFHNAPNHQEFQKECVRLLKDVHCFDVLRGDKTTAGAGLEIRVPFFDKDFIRFYMSIDPKHKMVKGSIEKYLLRKAFENDLPEEIVWRRKDGFSDGVSNSENPWYEIINEYSQKKYGMDEKDMYQMFYDKYYKDIKNIPYMWMPKWTDQKNPSGRLIL